MSKSNTAKTVDTIIDFAIIIAVSLTIFYGSGLLGASTWVSLSLVALWGAFTGYKPHIVRTPFKFMYRDD